MLARMLETIGRWTMSRLAAGEARERLRDHNVRARLDLAAADGLSGEMLLFLADDEDARVRANVAANPSAPLEADEKLAGDADDTVRRELARKIARLVPGIDRSEQARLYDRTVAVLERLAEDILPEVRQIVAEEIKEAHGIPASIVRSLAHDLDSRVCVPVLEYSPLLADEDLIEIVASGQVEAAVEAIARRSGVSADISDAIVARFDIPAIAALLANPRSAIREEAMMQVVDHAEDHETLQHSIVMRPDLSVRAIKRIAQFIARDLIDTLIQNHPLDEETVAGLRSRVADRIDLEGLRGGREESDASSGEERARAAYREGRLNDAFVSNAATLADQAAVVTALALLTGEAPSIVKRILTSRSAQGITAIVWKAGLSMRTAVTLQATIGRVPLSERLAARNGVDYPLSPELMEWHLEFFGTSA